MNDPIVFTHIVHAGLATDCEGNILINNSVEHKLPGNETNFCCHGTHHQRKANATLSTFTLVILMEFPII